MTQLVYHIQCHIIFVDCPFKGHYFIDALRILFCSGQTPLKQIYMFFKTRYAV